MKNKLQNHNQKAKIIVDKHYKELDSSFYQDIFLHLLEGNKEEIKEIKTPDLINFSIKQFIKFNSLNELISLLEDITRGFYGNIIRCKGNIKTSNHIYHFELVNNLYSINEINDLNSEIKNSEIVFIGYSVNKLALRNRMVIEDYL